jgi:hypothetical protein
MATRVAIAMNRVCCAVPGLIAIHHTPQAALSETGVLVELWWALEFAAMRCSYHQFNLLPQQPRLPTPPDRRIFSVRRRRYAGQVRPTRRTRNRYGKNLRRGPWGVPLLARSWKYAGVVDGIVVLSRSGFGPQSVRSSVVRAHTSPTESTG